MVVQNAKGISRSVACSLGDTKVMATRVWNVTLEHRPKAVDNPKLLTQKNI